MMDGGSWTFTPTASGYVFVEHGALGQMGEGTATLTGNVARLTFLRRVLGPRNIEVSLNGPVMVGTQKVLFINVPFQALRVEP